VGQRLPAQRGLVSDSQEWVEKQFTGVPEDEIDYIVSGNAAKVFGFKI
jgi:hypothetical protein